MSPFLNCMDSETACSQTFPHLGTVRYQSSTMYNTEPHIIPCLFLSLLSTTKRNQCILRSNNFTKFTFYFPFCTTWHIKTGGFLTNTAFFQHCIHICRQRISKFDAQASRWNGEFSISGGRWITPASDSFILGANILPVPTFIIFRLDSVMKLL